MQNTRRCNDVMQMRIQMMKKKGGGKNSSLTEKQALRFGLSAGKCVYLTRDSGLCDSRASGKRRHAAAEPVRCLPWNLFHLSQEFPGFRSQPVSFKLWFQLKIVSRQWNESEHCRFQLRRHVAIFRVTNTFSLHYGFGKNNWPLD